MSVKGSAQYRMVVMPYRPMRKVFSYFVIGLVLLIAVTASFFLGYAQSTTGPQDAVSLEKAEEELESLREEADSLRQEVANLKLAAVVDQQAHEDIRRQAVEQKATIADLEHDITVYRGMLPTSSGTNPSGISVSSFAVTGAGGVRGYRYKLLVQQLSANKDAFKGTLKFTVVGNKDGKPLEVPLHQVSPQVTTALIPLDFKFFQSLEGDLVLPEGFQPERVSVIVQSLDRKKTTYVERQLDWVVPAP